MSGDLVTIRICRGDGGNSLPLEQPLSHIDGTPTMPGATAQAVVMREIHTLTELSWPRIAELIGVERQTTYRWRNGASADEMKLARALDVLDILREAKELHGTGRDLRV